MVANTTETLLLGDLETLKLSEIPWQSRGGIGGSMGGGGGDGDGLAGGAGAEKFIFDSPSAALVYHASELSIIEYGRNEVRVWCFEAEFLGRGAARGGGRGRGGRRSLGKWLRALVSANPRLGAGGGLVSDCGEDRRVRSSGWSDGWNSSDTRLTWIEQCSTL